MDGWLLAIVVIGGPLLLGLVMFLVSSRQRRLTKAEKDLTQQKTRENWGKEQIR